MNDFGVLLIGAAVRCTAFAILGTLLYAVLLRKGPSAGALVAFSTLMMLVAVSALSLCPWPRWWTVAPRDAAEASRPQARLTPTGREADPSATAGTEAAPDPPKPLSDEAGESMAAVFLREFWQGLRRPPVTARGSHWGWPAWCAVVFLAGTTIELLRLVLGLRAVHALRRRSVPIEGQRLRDLVDLLRAEVCCTRKVAVHESSEIATPATVGWVGPMILLPPCWREWDDRECRVVVAHELAHVRRDDYLSGLLARLSLALHFYHPLARWLLGRLRLQQELAADSWGARLAGGQSLYLTTLAQMALRQADRPASWPARGFLPTRGTFLRRIEMLRDMKTLPPPSLPRIARVFTLGTLAAAGLLLAGVRGGPGPSRALAQAPATRPDAGPPTAAYDLTSVPAATDLLIALRPATLLARPEFGRLVEALKPSQGPEGIFDMPLEAMEQVLVVWLRPVKPPPPEGQAQPLPSPSAIIFRSAKGQDWKALATNMIGETVPVNRAGQVYNRATRGVDPESYFTPDDRTLILASETDLQFLMNATTGKPSRHPWDDAWEQVEPGQMTIAVGSTWLARHLVPNLIRPGGPAGNQGQFDAFAPLWTEAHGYALGVDLSKGLAFDLAAACGSDEGAVKVEQTVRALLTLTGNLMDQFRQKIGVAPREAVEPMQLLGDTIDPLLAKARSEHKGRIARIQSATDLDLEAVVKVLLPAVQAARVAARRSQSVNNLKQLALAMHNYYSVNDKFPPAVLYGPDGKTPYSWRIALLPYLEQADLYNQYKFNEPWDGPSNRELLDRMPAVFGHPGLVDSSRKLAYFALVGPDTIFGVKGGTGLAQITDGTSNTIMFVEAKRDIPWTKPEDIPYDKAKPVPELGGFSPGGFNAALTDGAVRFIKSSVNETILRALFTRAGGEVLSRDAY